MKRTKGLSAAVAVLSAITVVGGGATVFAVEGIAVKSFGNQRFERQELTTEQKDEMVANAKERLAQQLTEGKITEEMYNQMLAAIDSGQAFMGGARKGRGFDGDMSKPSELTDEQKADMEAKMADMKAKRLEQLAQDLADGKITQEQYDEMINAEPGRAGGMRMGQRSELANEQKTGKFGTKSAGIPQFNGEQPAPSELTDEQKADMEAKMADMKAKRLEQLAQDLADGKITQEQYDEMINSVDKPMISRGMGDRRKGGCGGFGNRSTGVKAQ